MLRYYRTFSHIFLTLVTFGLQKSGNGKACYPEVRLKMTSHAAAPYVYVRIYSYVQFCMAHGRMHIRSYSHTVLIVSVEDLMLKHVAALL